MAAHIHHSYQYEGNRTRHLQTVNVTVLDMDYCVKSYTDMERQITETMFCAGDSHERHDACSGKYEEIIYIILVIFLSKNNYHDILLTGHSILIFEMFIIMVICMPSTNSLLPFVTYILGDSGGALSYRSASTNDKLGKSFVIGIVSW